MFFDLYRKLLWFVIKPPKILFIAGVVLFVGALIFNYDFFYWWTKVANFLYIDKVIRIMSAVIESVIPSI